MYNEQYNQIIIDEIKKYPEMLTKFSDINFLYLIKAIIKVESDFNPKNITREDNVNDYSTGLMQLRLTTTRWLIDDYNITDTDLIAKLFDPLFNLYCGIKYIAYQSKYYNNIMDVIASYNAGTAIKHTEIKIDNKIYTDIYYNVKTKQFVKRVYNNITQTYIWQPVSINNAEYILEKNYINQNYVNTVMKYYTEQIKKKYPT